MIPERMRPAGSASIVTQGAQNVILFFSFFRFFAIIRTVGRFVLPRTAFRIQKGVFVVKKAVIILSMLLVCVLAAGGVLHLNTVADYQSIIAQKDRTLLALTSAAQDSEAQIMELTQQAEYLTMTGAARDGQISALTAELEAANERIAQLAAEGEDKDGQIDSLSRQVETYRAKQAEYAQQIEGLLAELEAAP